MSMLRQGLTRQVRVSIGHGRIDSIMVSSVELVNARDHTVISLRPPEMPTHHLRMLNDTTAAFEHNDKLCNAITPDDRTIRLELVVLSAGLAIRIPLLYKIVRRDYSPGLMSRMFGSSADLSSTRYHFCDGIGDESVLHRLAAYDSARLPVRHEHVLNEGGYHSWRPRNALLIQQFQTMVRRRDRALEVLRCRILADRASDHSDTRPRLPDINGASIVQYWRHISRHTVDDDQHDVRRLLRRYEVDLGGSLVDVHSI